MKADKAIATYRRMRAQPLWRLLASTTGPTVIGLLQSHLYESERSLPASIFHERIARDLEELRAQGEDFPQTAQAYVASWLADGFLERRFPAGASEEEYELSTAAVEAIRFVSGLAQPHSVATESRLTLVIEALARLAEDTDTDKFRRIDRLMVEQARIDKEIDAIQKGQMRVLPHTTALERTREIITLADDLAGDFRRVRDKFDQLNRDLRERIMDNNGNRGDVLDSLFAGIDLISESDAGRTFSAFWRLLTDPEQAATLDQALDSVMSREYVFRPIVTAHSEKGVTGDSEVVTGDSDLIVTDLGRRRNHRSRCRNRRSRSNRNGLCGQRGNHPCHGYPRALCAERRDAGGADCHAQHQGAVTAQVRLRALA